MNEYLEEFKIIPFCFDTFGVRRSIAVLDPENHPASGSEARAYRGRLTAKI